MKHQLKNIQDGHPIVFPSTLPWVHQEAHLSKDLFKDQRGISLPPEQRAYGVRSELCALTEIISLLTHGLRLSDLYRMAVIALVTKRPLLSLGTKHIAGSLNDAAVL